MRLEQSLEHGDIYFKKHLGDRWSMRKRMRKLMGEVEWDQDKKRCKGTKRGGGRGDEGILIVDEWRKEPHLYRPNHSFNPQK